MKNKNISSLTVALAAVSLFLIGCEDDVSNIGSSITPAEMTIHVDSATYNLKGKTVDAPSIGSKSAYTLLGSINVPEYGELKCSYVTQFLPVEQFNIPDSIGPENIDSVKMKLSVPRALVTGDSLAIQQVKVFPLTKQLPADISADFDPSGYYDPTAIGVKNYSMRGMTFTDTAYISSNTVNVDINLPKEFGQKILKEYNSNPETFVWPQKFAKFFPGVFLDPSFGNGCVSAVSSTRIFAYYPTTREVVEKDEEGNTHTVSKQFADSVCMMTTAPEVISSVNISYTPSASLKQLAFNGNPVITTPGGYAAQIQFPTRELLQQYWGKEYDLGVINNLIFSLPATPIYNEYGIGVPPGMLMVKSSELESFFAEGRVPDNKTSFYSTYNQTERTYQFSSMRQYMVDMRDKGELNVSNEDESFTLIPVSITTEEYTNPSTGEKQTMVTSVIPYIAKPTMVELDTENALIVFTFSNQRID